jgi:hypothetical protein
MHAPLVTNHRKFSEEKTRHLGQVESELIGHEL